MLVLVIPEAASYRPAADVLVIEFVIVIRNGAPGTGGIDYDCEHEHEHEHEHES